MRQTPLFLVHMEPVPIHSQQELFGFDYPKDNILLDDSTFIPMDKEIRANPSQTTANWIRPHELESDAQLMHETISNPMHN
ncbi:hypothetical protein PGT21_020598 [Puccinia graminis f. sp. tritici]|uniref:Uncharacterized protein n=1 Tax=Puccinia graminis f. sp. tritici TaxID=56615 RepID=A0A5B0M2T8_PUCGR|nr:hypothetical protein PGT21_020598 [Puccinia graminis f. sp. tritici]KAA1071102.1 hypothetical protein PGTUg99_014878 [Puccinia graminis f. sp. tritici]